MYVFKHLILVHPDGMQDKGTRADLILHGNICVLAA
jgi:hypothetical protein